MINSEIPIKTRKKLIEVSLPLDAINAASAREKSIRHGHPSTLHLWWARRPLATARAVIFSQMVDDPSEHTEEFPTEGEQDKERQRLFRLIEQLVLWENTTNEDLLQQAKAEIWKSWRATCADNYDHPRAAELFNSEKLPAFHDPFAGGGTLPLEAQRLGLEAHASDLNPVAVLINKAMIDIPPRFAGQPPVNPDTRKANSLLEKEFRGAQGLAQDVRYYGQCLREEAEKRIGHLYPKIDITLEMASERPDLKQYVGQKLTVIAWLWARTVKSPNPAFAHIDVPLVSTFMLSKKKGKEAYVEPVVENGSYQFNIKVGNPGDVDEVMRGTKLTRSNFRCVMSGTPIPGDYIKSESMAGRIGARLIAVVAEGHRSRIYLPPTIEHEKAPLQARSQWEPDLTISGSTQYIGVKPYGMDRFSKIFSDRQLVALTTFSDLVQEVRERVKEDATATGLLDDGRKLSDGGRGATAYSEAIGVYLGFVVDKGANYWSSLCTWHSGRDGVSSTFGRQAIPMVWDYTEANPFSGSSGNVMIGVEQASKMLERLGFGPHGAATQGDAASQSISKNMIVSTDPPYFDNVPYADLSDFFYVWLRRSQRGVFPELFATLSVPKAEELVAFAYRHDNKKAKAQTFFLDGMTQAMEQLAKQIHPAFPITIYYAFRQVETDDSKGVVSTGWDTFLDAVISAGLRISGTWPVRTEYTSHLKTKRNALASSVVLVCSPRTTEAQTITRREFVALLRDEMPTAVGKLRSANIAPVDLAQAVIGPGMAIYTSYASVLDASGEAMSVGDALVLINQTLDEVLSEQEGSLDSDSLWAITWFDQQGFSEGDYGVAETLSKSRNTSVDGMVRAGILASGQGKVRLLRPTELPEGWDPTTDTRTPLWESAHHLVRVLESGGETAAAELVSKLEAGTLEGVRDLAYRLYGICERKNRTTEALSYNALVQSWPAIMDLSRQDIGSQQGTLL